MEKEIIELKKKAEYRNNILKKNALNHFKNSLNSLVHLDLITFKEVREFEDKLDKLIYLKNENQADT